MYVQLGEKAGMFYDPTSRVKVLPGQVVEVATFQQHSKKLIKAIKGGHLDKATKEDFDKCENSIKAPKGPVKKAKVEKEEDKFDREKAIEQILTDFDGYTKKELGKKKDEELAVILAED